MRDVDCGIFIIGMNNVLNFRFNGFLFFIGILYYICFLKFEI